MALSSLCELSFEELLIKFSNRTTEFVRILHVLCQSRRGQDMYNDELVEYAELEERSKKLERESNEFNRELMRKYGKEAVEKMTMQANEIVSRRSA